MRYKPNLWGYHLLEIAASPNYLPTLDNNYGRYYKDGRQKLFSAGGKEIVIKEMAHVLLAYTKGFLTS